MPTNAESTTTSKISSSSGSLDRHSGSHSRTLLVSSAVRLPRFRSSRANSIIGSFGIQVLEEQLAHAREVEPLGQLARQQAAELGLGDLAALEGEQRMVAVSTAAARAMACPSSSVRHARLLLVGEEPAREGHGEHSPEVGDEGASHAAAGGSIRTVSS